jgi:hypothetical protein
MKTETQLTAVEWLVDQICGDHTSEWQKQIEQAKEMERQQIMSAFTQGDIFGADYYDGVNITEENYYKQNFKSE